MNEARRDVSLLEPRDATDTFCTCPRCELLAHHMILGEGNYAPTLLADANGKFTIDASYFGQRTSGRYVERECVFFGHRWKRDYQAPSNPNTTRDVIATTADAPQPEGDA